MIGRLLGWGRRTPMESRLDALETAIDAKLQALLVTATQAIAEAVRAELVRERQRAKAAAAPTAPSRRPPTRSLLEVEKDGAAGSERRRAVAGLTAFPGAARTERRG